MNSSWANNKTTALDTTTERLLVNTVLNGINIALNLMAANKIPLREIERSITVNCAVDKKANKSLTLYNWQTGVNRGVARSVFIYIALKCQYNQEEICDYLTITASEFSHKAAVLEDLHSKGRELFNTINNKDLTLAHTATTELTFYRKLLLAQNYLRYRFGYVSG